MSLDIVEFVVGVEIAFGIRIPDDVATAISTPRQLINFIHGTLPRKHPPRCWSQRSFYLIRRALTERLQIPRSSMRPDTKLLAVLPAQNSQEHWAKIGASLGFSSWPRVHGEGWWSRIFQNDRPRTLGEAARHVATCIPDALKPSGESWSWQEVATIVDGLMRYHFGITEYSLDDRFVQDLRLG